MNKKLGIILSLIFVLISLLFYIQIRVKQQFKNYMNTFQETKIRI